ncbi:riboflavin synthase [Moraxella osloensis]|uniref:Riboflavin synthase n=1 Tax=Enhydrobacter aerosaccus TaxID=225324 RepID=A0ABR5IIQ7_9HYPH|nr:MULTISPECIES: riboflavin synthase [Enhydrobacter]EEV22495.1 riboflavin synthase, alpha subunit [Enhydrobacter aerosaccus SK60]KND17348.1 riboflavin synthase subunit alpha [Enhydrobacter aerosaccus]QCR86795.1 riboflavin synthase [Moraxella osloensis]VXA90112.1 Riboflavin synthase [Enhydrobacter sp. AX1]
MFTGIIEATGKIVAITPTQGDVRLKVQSDYLDFADVKLGDSIASNGICLTVVEQGKDWYAVDVSRETLNKTAMQQWQVGDVVNLEKAMLPTTRFGGHIVTGHVDTTGTVKLIKNDSRSIYIEIEIPSDFTKYVATKGSVTVDGISLTSNLVEGNVISLNIIPHTAQVTNISRHWKVATKVNIEVDVVARYLEKLLMSTPDNMSNSNHEGITLSFLQQNGFSK